MSLITTPIGKQAFELVHDQIGIILKSELEGQLLLTYDTDFELDLWKERDVPFNDSELQAANLSMQRGEFDMQTLIQHTGVYKYMLDVIFNAKGTTNKLGDTIAMTKVQKVIGVCRAIIMSPKYVTLGFAAPFISNRRVESIEFGKPVRQDSSHTCMGRMLISVTVNETVDFSEFQIVNGIDTNVKLALTDLGYKYISDYY